MIGGASGTPQAPPRRRGLRTLGARYLGQGRAVVYGAVLANCSAAGVRFVASPAARRGGGAARPIVTRLQRVSGAYGLQVVCARISGLRPGRTYRVRNDSRQTRGTVGGTRTLRALPTGRSPPAGGLRLIDGPGGRPRTARLPLSRQRWSWWPSFVLVSLRALRCVASGAAPSGSRRSAKTAVACTAPCDSWRRPTQLMFDSVSHAWW